MREEQLLKFVGRFNLDAYNRLTTAARGVGLRTPSDFGDETKVSVEQVALPGAAGKVRLEILTESIGEAIEVFRVLNLKIHDRLKTRSKLKLALNGASAVSAGGLFTLFGLNQAVVPWNMVLAAGSTVASVAAVVVDHLGVKTQTFWNEFAEGAKATERANVLLIRAKLVAPTDDDRINSLENEALSVIEQLRTIAVKLGLDLYRDE